MLMINNTPIIVDMETVLTILAQEMHEKFGMDYFGRPIRSGNNVMVKCPFHKNGQERSPSMGIRIDDGRFNCFTCDESMNSKGEFDMFIAKCLRLGEVRDEEGNIVKPCKPELGYKWLLTKFNLAVQGDRPTLDLDFSRDRKGFSNFVPESQIAQYYEFGHPYMLEVRKIPQKTQDYLEIGYDLASHSVIFLMRDLKGNIVYVKKRPISSNLRYANVKDVPKRHLMFGAWYIHRDLNLSPKEWMLKVARERGVAIVEGEIDCATYWSMGQPCVAIGGKIFFEQQARVLQRLGIRRVLLSLDNDESGIGETIRIKRDYSTMFRFDEVKYPDWAKDINDIAKAGKDMSVLTIV